MIALARPRVTDAQTQMALNRIVDAVNGLSTTQATIVHNTIQQIINPTSGGSPISANPLRLPNDTSGSLSSGLEVLIRSDAGVLEASQDGARSRRLLPAYAIHVRDYGAVGDGVTDDYAAIWAAIQDSWTLAAWVQFDMKTYGVGQEIRIPSGKHTALLGTAYVNGKFTTLKALTAEMRSIISLGERVDCRYIAFDANRLALTGVYQQTCSSGTFEGCGPSNTQRDGVFKAGEQDSTHHCSEDLTLESLRWLRANNIWVADDARVAHSGVRCSTSSASAVVTFSGTIDLTTLGITNGGARIIMVSGSTVVECNVATIDSATQLTCSLVVGSTLTNASFVVMNTTHSINDSNHWVGFTSGAIGTVFASNSIYPDYSAAIRDVRAGTAAVTATGTTLTLTGGPDLTTLKLRRGDSIHIGSGGSKQKRLLDRVTSASTLEVVSNEPWTSSVSGQPFAFCSGDSLHECVSSDNNIDVFDAVGVHSGIANSVFALDGFYGPTIIGGQFQFTGGHTVRIGTGGAVWGTTLIRNYNEGGRAGPAEWLLDWSGQGTLVLNPHDNLGAPATNFKRYAATAGVYWGKGGIAPIGTGLTLSIPVNALLNAQISGRLTHDSATGSLASPGTTIEPSWEYIGWNPGSSDVTLTATPMMTLGGHRDIHFTVDPGATGSVTVQDDAVASGSKLKLRTPKVVLRAGEGIRLYNNGTWLYEAFRTFTASSRGDSSASPGNATLNKQSGRSAIASGATACVVTNDHCVSATASHVRVDFEDSPGTTYKVVPGAGSFTVTLDSVAGADIKFHWAVL